MAEPNTVNGTISLGSVCSTDPIIMDPLTLFEVVLDGLPARLRIVGPARAVSFEAVEHPEEEPSLLEGFVFPLVEEVVEPVADGADDRLHLGAKYPVPPLKWIHYPSLGKMVPLFPLEDSVTCLDPETAQTGALETEMDPFWGCL